MKSAASDAKGPPVKAHRSSAQLLPGTCSVDPSLDVRAYAVTAPADDRQDDDLEFEIGAFEHWECAQMELRACCWLLLLLLAAAAVLGRRNSPHEQP